MQSTTMRLPLSFSHLLERARQLFPSREGISRLPNRSLHLEAFFVIPAAGAVLHSLNLVSERPA